MRIVMLAAAGAAMTAMAGCSNIETVFDGDYHFGDTSRSYCESVDPSMRAVGRGLAASLGITLVDYCGALGISVVDDEAVATVASTESAGE